MSVCNPRTQQPEYNGGSKHYQACDSGPRLSFNFCKCDTNFQRQMVVIVMRPQNITTCFWQPKQFSLTKRLVFF